MKKFLLLPLCLFLTLPVLADDFEYEFEGQTLKYTVLDEEAKTCSTIQGAKITGVLAIPSVAKNGQTEYTVAEIGAKTLYGSTGLTKVTIPNTVKTIGDQAFYNCKALTAMDIPNSVNSLGNTTFFSCSSLKSLTIPSSVTTIGDRTFASCSGLTTVNIPATVSSIGINPFSNCGKLTEIIVDAESQNYISEEGILYNKDMSLLISYPMAKSASTFSIPNTVTAIGDYALYECQRLTSVTIPDKVTTIGNYSFYDVSLKSLKIPNSVLTIGNSAFVHCVSLSELDLGTSVTTIGNSAFSSCEALTVLTIPNSVTKIGNSAFAQCGKLTTIIISDNVKEFGTSIWSQCTSIQYIYYYAKPLTEANTNIFPQSIYSTAYLWQRDLSDVAPWNAFTKRGQTSYREFNYTYEGQTMRYWVLDFDKRTATTKAVNGNLEGDVIIPPVVKDGGTEYTVTTVGQNTFGKCSNLKSVTLPNTITKIESYAFYGCLTLKQVNIPSSVQKISQFAFYYCSLLPSITLPEGITTIENAAFAYCEALKSITFPQSLTEIGNQAFTHCESLTSVTIPSGVEILGKASTLSSELNPFGGCEKLTEINVEADNKNFTSQDGVLFNKDMTTLIGYPAGKKGETYTIPTTVNKIGSDAFYASVNLTSIDIPENVSELCRHSFSSCKFKSIHIPASITTFGEEVWYGNDEIEKVYYAAKQPVAASEDLFPKATYESAVLYLPKEAVEAAKTIQPWSLFQKKEALAGVDDLLIDGYENGPIKVYNLQGLYVSDQIANLPKGLYIVCQGGKTQKISIK